MAEQREKDRIFKLALSGTTLAQIAERMGMSRDQVRRIVERAEAKNEVPPGTLRRVCPNSRKAKDG